MNKIYVILEDMGEWSDHTTTVVCACSTIELAKSKVLKLTQAAKLKSMTDRRLEDMNIIDNFYEQNPPPKSSNFKDDEQYAAKVNDWNCDFEQFQEDQFDKVSKIVNVDQFDELKDRYYDYPHYTYKQVELHDK